MSRMSRSRLWGRPTPRCVSVATPFAVAALVAAAPPAFGAQAEQVNRADGIAGAYPIESSETSWPVISADGATAYFVLHAAEGGWSKATGLYRRDVATNTTTAIAAGGDIQITSLSADGRYVGFTTAKGLVGSDGNRTRDLYGYDATTKKFNLVSRANGVNGAPLGLTSGAFITRDGKSALLGTKSGVLRRDLATGTTTRVGNGKLTGYPFAVEARSDRSASVDGKVYALENAIVSPRGIDALPGSGGTGAIPLVSPSGRWAIATRSVAASSGTGTSRQTTLLDTSNGASTVLDLRAEYGETATVQAFTPSDTALVSRRTETGTEILEVSLTGAPARTVATFPKTPVGWLLNDTGKFLGTGGAGVASLISADDVAIPGGADLPSPGAQLSVWTGCRATVFPLSVPARPTSITATSKSVEGSPYPTLGSLTVRIVNRSGKVLADGTLENVAPVTANLPSSGHPYKVTATTKYLDGRSATESWTLAAPSQSCFPALF